MVSAQNNVSSGRWLAVLIAVGVISLGSYIFFQAYAPGRFTRFGYVEPLTGEAAMEFGFIVMLIGLLPLLALCKNTRQVQILGSLWGVFLVLTIFITAYL